MDHQQPHQYNGIPNHWVRNYSTDSASLSSATLTDKWDTSVHGIVGGLRGGTATEMHAGKSAPLEYNGQDITAQLQDGTIHQLAPRTLVLGRFYVQRSLGKGGMSNVYLAEDQHFSPPHNLRSLKEMIGRLDEQNHLSNFEREANVLASLRHPRIPRVYDYFTIYHRAYLVLDYIEGQDLEATLHRTPGMARPEDVVEWMLQLCEIVQYLHTQPQPIVFRDLKPNNIILTPEGDIVLIDFGIAKLLQQTGAIDTNVGTIGYAAPEMYEGRAERRSDIFALGAMMHHLLTKQDPRLRSPFSFHQHPIRHYNPAVTPDLDAVVMKCVQQPIDKRFQSISELRAALEAAIGRQAVYSRPSTGGVDYRPGQIPSTSRYKTTTIWRYETENEVRATPQVSHDTVFIGSYDNNLHAIDRKTGALRWKFPTEGGICVTPAIWKDTVIFGSQDFNVYSLLMDTGTENWRYRTWNRVHSSPRLYGDRLYIGSDDMYIHAIDPRNGVMIWRHPTYREIWSSAAYEDGIVFLGSSDSSVYAVDALTGDQRWRARAQAEVISSPAVIDGYVYFGSMDFMIYAVDMKSGWQAWRTPTEGHVISSPLVVDDQLYVGSTDNNLYCLDRQTGRVNWKFSTGGQVNSSPTFDADTSALYFGSNDHNVYSLDLQGNLRWRFPTGDIVPGSACVRHGVCYIGSVDGYLYALRAEV
jgi:outer membrane protein assembly factor BamB/tRNA A-37 threonylcarbamoyl transferase component Bud32